MKKANGYSNEISRAKRARRQDEAVTRAEQWESLTPAQQVASLRSRRGESKRQIARILGA